MRFKRDFIAFCSSRCNKEYVAREGIKQQEELERAGYTDTDLNP